MQVQCLSKTKSQEQGRNRRKDVLWIRPLGKQIETKELYHRRRERQRQSQKLRI